MKIQQKIGFIFFLGILLWIGIVEKAHSELMVYDFSFSNTLESGVNGTVSGKIFGLDNSISNQYQQASRVIISSVPSVFSPAGSSSDGGYQTGCGIMAQRNIKRIFSTVRRGRLC